MGLGRAMSADAERADAPTTVGQRRVWGPAVGARFCTCNLPSSCDEVATDLPRRANHLSDLGAFRPRTWVKGGAKCVYVKTKFSHCVRQISHSALDERRFLFLKFENHAYCPPSRPNERGVSRGSSRHAGRDVVDAMVPGPLALNDRQCRGRQRRAGLAPQWQVPSPAVMNRETTETTKPGLSGVSTRISR